MDVSELSNPEIVTLAVFALGGDSDPVDTEDVAIEANDLAPGRFAWRKYPDQINHEHITNSLRDAKKAKNGGLVAGGGTRGWRLSPAGLAWAQTVSPGLMSDLRTREIADRGAAKRRRIELERIRQLPAWRKHTAGQAADVQIREAEAVFRLTEYVHGDRRTRLMDRIRNLFVGDEDMSGFLERMTSLAARTRGSDQ